MEKDKIVDIVKSKLENISANTSKEREFGYVINVADGIAQIEGLEKTLYNEILEFEDGSRGLALNLDYEFIGCTILNNQNESRTIEEGTKVYATGKVMETGVGDEYLGRIVNPLGEVLDGGSSIKTNNFYPVERQAPGIMTRQGVNRSLQTGIKVVDALVPIGKGQRELIIGDKKTGKTAIAIDAIISQKGQNVKCVYVAVGQKQSTIMDIKRQLEAADALEYTVIVASPAADAPALKYLAPFTGTAIAEYWADKGEDVVIIYDDLTKHADAYRSLSLLLRRPPGREAYPGDVFYLHSRLLERSLQYSAELGGGSITGLPIIETQNGDISAYIPTNVISITDGQIFLMKSLFNQGQKPALDVGLSVSRVGGDAQTKAMKEVVSSLKLDLAQYNELKAFTQFGSDLDEATQKVLDKGAAVVEVLKQVNGRPLDLASMVSVIYLCKENLITEVPIADIIKFEEAYLVNLKANKKLVDEINTNKVLNDEIKEQFTTIFKDTLKSFKK